MDYEGKKWLHLRGVVLRRDGYQDQYLKRLGKMVPADRVHHIFPAEEYPEYQWCAWNLISLSKQSHNKMHDRENNDLTYEGLLLMQRTARKNGIPFLRAAEMERKRPYERKHYHD